MKPPPPRLALLHTLRWLDSCDNLKEKIRRSNSLLSDSYRNHFKLHSLYRLHSFPHPVLWLSALSLNQLYPRIRSYIQLPFSSTSIPPHCVKIQPNPTRSCTSYVLYVFR